ncbi:phosphotransferase [Arenicella xantha]|uniref:Polymerase/histidinol phosphatase N-terminal domain-containing protein n=1 Tax=Arenicella xantha TaxID=644221 RepID=A0A395JQ18_9GAMM|nr:phosphotransferase [Arenicella xantha]RBP52715.1 hypothetical protein DFR28_10197 [Arenicella xantha]
MKKIDFHMHTVATFSDPYFDFCLETLKRYVDEAKLDAIAITNHDIFDLDQFIEIREALGIVVFPGIEINLERGHLLLISDGEDLDDFKAKADMVSAKINSVSDDISVDELDQIYGDLSEYLLIPHYEKRPPIKTETLARLKSYIQAGEVRSVKLFVGAAKEPSKLTPVLFSDERICAELDELPVRQTFIDCGDLKLNAIKQCFLDKSKVTLTEKDGNSLFLVFNDGPLISTGLNVLLGARSSGKTVTLDKIHAANKDIKYIRQFDLVQKDPEKDKKEFEDNLRIQRSQSADEYLSGFKRVLEEMVDVDLRYNEKEVENYVESLLKSAEEADREDSFSKMALFNETLFKARKDDELKKLFLSVQHVIENVAYRNTIEKHIDLVAMKRLACDLLNQLWGKELLLKKKKVVDEMVTNIKAGLKRKSNAVQLEDVDFYDVAMDIKRVERFNEIVGFLKADYKIEEENIQGFRIVVRKKAFAGAGEVRDASTSKPAFGDAYKHYRSPYEYLKALQGIDRLPETELFRLFTSISYEILNRDGDPVSGGERSEFRLLQKIKDAHHHEMLLIDEPESSFDNVFLNENVNQIIKDISETMPVVVVTHNSTLGASVDADYTLFASKEYDVFGDTEYKLYSGYPTDKTLVALDGSQKSNHEIMMTSLEAGEVSYQTRKDKYAAIKN